MFEARSTYIQVVAKDGGLVALVRGRRTREFHVELRDEPVRAQARESLEVRLERGLADELPWGGDDMRLKADRKAAVGYARIRVHIREDGEHASRLRVVTARVKVIECEARARWRYLERAGECGVHEGEVLHERGGRVVGRLRRPRLLVLHALQCGLPDDLARNARGRKQGADHAVGDTVTDDLIHDVPRGDVRSHALNLRLNVLRDDSVHEIARGHGARQPRLNNRRRSVRSMVRTRECTYRRLGVRFSLPYPFGGLGDHAHDDSDTHSWTQSFASFAS
jgi:hypothetical protein